jgi:hypothetical protein
MSKQYIEFDHKQGYPSGPDLFYECQRCGKMLPSMAKDNVWCDCYNLCVDVDFGRLAVQDDSLVRLVRLTNNDAGTN